MECECVMEPGWEATASIIFSSCTTLSSTSKHKLKNSFDMSFTTILITMFSSANFCFKNKVSGNNTSTLNFPLFLKFNKNAIP
jgi:hypothetical protein